MRVSTSIRSGIRNSKGLNAALEDNKGVSFLSATKDEGLNMILTRRGLEPQRSQEFPMSDYRIYSSARHDIVTVLHGVSFCRADVAATALQAKKGLSGVSTNSEISPATGTGDRKR
jgi:hypothetical protein